MLLQLLALVPNFEAECKPIVIFVIVVWRGLLVVDKFRKRSILRGYNSIVLWNSFWLDSIQVLLWTKQRFWNSTKSLCVNVTKATTNQSPMMRAYSHPVKTRTLFPPMDHRLMDRMKYTIREHDDNIFSLFICKFIHLSFYTYSWLEDVMWN